MFTLHTLSLSAALSGSGLDSPVRTDVQLSPLAAPKSEPNLKSAFIFPSEQAHTSGKRPIPPRANWNNFLVVQSYRSNRLSIGSRRRTVILGRC
jgi:hypothetical protein